MRDTKRFITCAAWSFIGFAGLAACTINVNDGNANQTLNRNVNTANVFTPAAATTPAQQQRARWTVAVCSSRSSEVTLQAGPNETDSRTFATWRASGGERIYELPARLQNLSEIHFRAIGAEANPVELCVLYDGRPKKRVAFDEGSENHTVAAGDGDDDDCRCTQ